MSMMRTFATVAFIVAAAGFSQSSNAQTSAAPAQQAADQDCEKIKQDIQQLQQDLANLSAEMQRLSDAMNTVNADISRIQADLKTATAAAAGGRLSGTGFEELRGQILDALAHAMALRKNLEQQIEDDSNLMQAIKNQIADLLSKLANCPPPSTTQPPKNEPAKEQPPQPPPPSQPQQSPPPTPTPASPQQAAGEDCEGIKQDIQQLQQDLANLSAEMQRLSDALNTVNADISRIQADLKTATAAAAGGRLSGTGFEELRGQILDALAHAMALRKNLEQQIEDDSNLMQAIKNQIADLLSKLANCPPPSTTQPPKEETPNRQPPPPKPEENKKVAFQLRGFGGATIVNGNAPSTAGFDGAVLFPLGNRVLVGPTAGFQWVDSSIVSTIGGGPPPSTFIDTSVGFKEGNFGGQIGLNLSGWELGIRGGATVAGSTITQNEGFCDPTAGCMISSTTTTHDRITSPFVGGYISHSIFSHIGVFAEFDYHRQKDNNVLDVSDRSVVGGLVLSFGRHGAK